jgi:hypothetical protein
VGSEVVDVVVVVLDEVVELEPITGATGDPGMGWAA